MVSPSLSVVSSSLVLLLANGGRAFSPAPGGALEEVMQSAEAALCDNVTQYSGYFKLATGDKNYFYCATRTHQRDPNAATSLSPVSYTHLTLPTICSV